MLVLCDLEVLVEQFLIRLLRFLDIVLLPAFSVGRCDVGHDVWSSIIFFPFPELLSMFGESDGSPMVRVCQR